MAQEFDPLNVLLIFFSPDHEPYEFLDLLSSIDDDQWDELVSEAYSQKLAPLLYSFLAKQDVSLSLPFHLIEQLHQTYLSNTVRNMLFLNESEIILAALQNAGIPATGLKGIYLLEHVYPNIGARSMNDIDLLVKEQDLPNCLAVMKELGYQIDTYFDLTDENIDTKHVPPMRKAGSPWVELHWTLLEEDEPFTIDADALWQRTVPAQIANVGAHALGVEDLILHLCLHLTYQHYLNLGLRGLLDIALVIHKFSAEIDWQKLVEIARSWGAERVTALTLKLVETQLNIPIPVEAISSLVPEGIEPSLLDNARRRLLERVWFDDHFTPDLVEFSANKNLLSKIKIGLQRVFIPRLALARIYNVPPTSPRIFGLYWKRLIYLIRNYGKTVVRLQRGEEGTEPARQKAEVSMSLHEWMSPHKK